MLDFKRQTRKTLTLSIPIIVGLIGQMSLEIVDTIMIGRLGTVELAAAGFSTTIVGILMLLGIGMCIPVQVLVAEAYGKRDFEGCGSFLQAGCLLVGLYSLIIAAIITPNIWILDHFKQTVDVATAAKPYTALLLWSLLPALIYTCFKSFSESLNRPWDPFVVLVGGITLNVFLNWVLIFGNLGAPRLELEGAGIATLISRIVIMVVLIGWTLRSRKFPVRKSFFTIRTLSRHHINRTLAIGIPSALQLLFEGGAFHGSAIFIGWISEQALAAHTIALRVVSTTFMIPLGVSFAMSIRVGHAKGLNDYEEIRRIAFSGIIFTTIFMLFVGLFYLVFMNYIPALFSTDAAVIHAAGRILLVVAIFQLFDAAQIAAQGALRGLADVKIPTMLSFVFYWLVSLPIGLFFALNTSMQAAGMWTGFAMGLSIASVVLVLRFHLITKPKVVEG